MWFLHTAIIFIFIMKQKILFILTIAILGTVASVLSFGFGSNVRAASQNSSQTVSVTVNTSITLSLASSTLPLTNLTPGTPVFATTSATVATNNNTGWNLGLARVNSTTTTLLSGSTTFPDYTAWDNASPNSVTSPGAVLSFRTYQTGTDAALYSSTWWGASDADGTAKWGGAPATSKQIANTNSYIGSNQAVVYGFRADAPGTQESGSYSGGITLTALTNP